MSKSNITGLGEPEPLGKKSLFNPTRELKDVKKKNKMSELSVKKIQPDGTKRIKTTIELTNDAMEILLNFQNKHRLKTGRVLPLWKIVSNAMLKYGNNRQGGNDEKP